MTAEMAAQKKLIDQLISSGVQPEPAPYEYNCELALTRTTLEGTKRRPSEDHKTYAKRWRKIAAKVEPPMTEDEIICTFIKAHDPPYFEEIFRMTGYSFAAIVNKLEEYDDFVRVGKIVNVSALKSQLDALQGQGSSGTKMQYNPQAICAYHSGAPGHATANCRLLKHKIQDMLEAGKIVIRKREEQGPNVNENPLPKNANNVGVIMDNKKFEEFVRSMSNETEVFGIMDQPFVIEETSYEEDKKPFILDLTPSESEALEPVVIKFPEQVPVLSLRQVPWNYSVLILQIGGKEIVKEEVSVVTRSGKIASSPTASAPVKINNHEPIAKPTVIKKEVWNFLRRFKRSEYNVVEQLNKMPAQISILDLLFSSDLHRNALLEVLTKAQILKDILVNNFSHIVGNVLTAKQITFSDEELPTEGIGHNKALNVAVRCNGKMLPKVLIDNGSALNICPWSTLMLKFVVNDQLITIFAEEDCIVIADSESEEDANQNASVSSYHIADIVSVSWIASEESKTKWFCQRPVL
ncbi:uncharacterized protein [Coffea arabica]|uniref:Retrotransposon gag domain-containing protein n=1 Tax=Coffea arabica TaxID=13443 RepID=A0ABM4WMN1_COFAR